ncbi:hypothetical protein [Saccharothrix texasensis]|uniref:Lysine--tRNA ligase n=1 Tax=Saccharothrix texasensis TaxID=103734 RepID=A0A3N1GZZ0_9PSEU|nr:hypothetical protein [Saccharothrix texasensis]ROP35779.1 lysyl-tRNA synthetase class I [Saccharothrix texasensis]
MSARLDHVPRDWCAVESDRIAALLERRGQVAGPVVFGAGFGPSGLPHVGTVSEVVRTSFVRRAFEEATGRSTRLVVVADDMDALRKVPDTVPDRAALTPHLGMPLHRVPDPWGVAPSLAEGMVDRLRRVLDVMEVDCEVVRSSDLYRSGRHDSAIRAFLADFAEVNALVGASVGALRRRSYSIVMPVSPHTGRVVEHTRVLDVDPHRGTITYEIPRDVVIQRPGLDHGLEPHEYYAGEPIGEPVTVSALGGGGKFQWKADWALRLLSGDIAYEMHGQDLADSARVVRQVFERLRREPPVLFEYGLFVDERGRKISKTVGNGFALDDAIGCLTREGLRMLLYRKPRRPRRFDLASVLRADDAVRHEARLAGDPRRGAGARLRLRRIGATAPPGGPRFGTLVRVLAACAPVDHAAAVAFVERVFPPGRRPEPDLVARAWRFHLHARPAPRSAVLDTTATTVLRRLADALASAPHADPGVLLHKALDGHPDAYRPLYLALLGRPHGPRLATWLRITGTRRSLALVRDALSRAVPPSDRSEGGSP